MLPGHCSVPRGGSPVGGARQARVQLVTVAVAVKVFDGIVLATDSATTLLLDGGAAQVYNGADKIFHLHRRRPVAAMTWGNGVIGTASIATLAKDLRRRFMGLDPARADWELQDDYTVEGVASRLVDMMFDELYAPLANHGVLGFLVAGYSGGSKASEAWLVILEDPATRPVPVLAAGPDQSGWMAYAQPEAIQRLFNGYDHHLVAELGRVIEAAHIPSVMGVLNRRSTQPAQPSMPLPDAINLAGFMVDVTIGYSRFLLGADTVGGPTEVASITRHEGFKWISRKHYYDPRLNPGDLDHDRQ